MIHLEKYLERTGLMFSGEDYTEGKPVWTDNWNNMDRDKFNRLYDLCESNGIILDWCDERITDDNGKSHSTTPNGWGWIPTYAILGDCQIWSQHEVSEHLEDYAELLVDCDTNADQWGTDFSPLGFRKYGYNAENGFHYGQNDTPETVRRKIESDIGPCEIIWSIDRTGQFDIHFSAWVKESDR